MIKILKHLKGNLHYYLAAVLCVFIQTMCDLRLPKLMGDMVNNGIMANDLPYIKSTGLIMIGVTLLGMIATVLSVYFIATAAAGFGKDLRHAAFSKIISFSHNEFDKIGVASIVTRATNDITQLQQFVLMSRIMISAPIMAIGGIIMAFTEARSLFWIILLVIGIVLTIIMTVFFTVVPLFKIVQKKIERLTLVMREALTGVRVIRAFNKADYEKKRFEKANADLRGTQLKIARSMAVMMPVMMLIMNCVSLLVTWVAGKQIQASITDLGSMMAFIQYAMQVMSGVMMVTMIFVFWPRASVSAGRVNEVLDSVNEIADPDEPEKPSGKARGKIEFKDVTFRFKGAESSVLTNISFASNPGEVTAIIGGTGSGKSTLVNLIPRFYDVESGSIEIDGVDIREMAQDDLRSRIGLVPQQAVLFSGTVSENICYGKEDATHDEIRHAAETSQALSFIEKMTEKYESHITAGATNISGGQKQRLSIARALVRKPEIYIFDDSFSALDFKTDAKLRAALKDEIKDSTAIIVAQRVSTIMDADRILVLSDGVLVGNGAHKELFADCEVYREIVLSQLSEEEIA